MKWILFMTLLYRGVAIDHVELGREDDCLRAAASWVAAQRNGTASAICVPKDAQRMPPPDRLK